MARKKRQKRTSNLVSVHGTQLTKIKQKGRVNFGNKNKNFGKNRAKRRWQNLTLPPRHHANGVFKKENIASSSSHKQHIKEQEQLITWHTNSGKKKKSASQAKLRA